MDDHWVPPDKFAAPECAAVGQSSLVALYDAMFKVYGMGCGQILTAAAPFLSMFRKFYTAKRNKNINKTTKSLDYLMKGRSTKVSQLMGFKYS